MVADSTLWLIPQIASHVAFLWPLYLSVRARRLEVSFAFVWMLIQSVEYHVCLGADLCFGTLAHAAATDWCGASLVSIALAVQFFAFPPAITTSIILLYAGMLTKLQPILADSTFASVVMVSIILMITFLYPLLFVTPAPYPGGLLGYAGMFMTVVSFGLFVFPRSSTDPVYNGLHSLWHIGSAIVSGIALLILDRYEVHVHASLPLLVVSRGTPTKDERYANNYPYAM